MGEQRSPKNAPESAAPPAAKSGAPMAPAIEMQMDTTVAAVPNEVPVKTETRQLSRKVANKNTPGLMSGTA